jgi:hypothetical protein
MMVGRGKRTLRCLTTVSWSEVMDTDLVAPVEGFGD